MDWQLWEHSTKYGLWMNTRPKSVTDRDNMPSETEIKILETFIETALPWHPAPSGLNPRHWPERNQSLVETGKSCAAACKYAIYQTKMMLAHNREETDTSKNLTSSSQTTWEALITLPMWRQMVDCDSNKTHFSMGFNHLHLWMGAVPYTRIEK